MTLEEIRLSKGLTLKQASNDLGISLSSLWKYEKGVNKLNDKIIKKLQDYYKVDSFDNIENPYINLTNQIETLREEVRLLEEQIESHIEYENKLIKENKEYEKKIKWIKKNLINKI